MYQRRGSPAAPLVKGHADPGALGGLPALRAALLAIAFAGMATAATANCAPPGMRPPAEVAAEVIARADLIIEAEVVGAEDVAKGRSALLHPLTVYKGAPAAFLVMARWPTGEAITSEVVTGRHWRVGERRFLVLYRTRRGYIGHECASDYAWGSGVREAIIDQTRTVSLPQRHRPLSRATSP